MLCYNMALAQVTGLPCVTPLRAGCLDMLGVVVFTSEDVILVYRQEVALLFKAFLYSLLH